MGETSCVIHLEYEKKYPDRQKPPQRPVFEENRNKARNVVAYKVREPKWLERDDPREYQSLKSLRRHVLNGDEWGIRCCAKNGVDLNKPFPDGGGPALVEVASKGDMKLVQTLLEIKAHPARGNATGYSPLMAAIHGGHWEVAGFLFGNLKPSEIMGTTKSGLSVLKAAAARRTAAEKERKELSIIVVRGGVPPHEVGAAVKKLEAAKTERERASLFLHDLYAAVDAEARRRVDLLQKPQAEETVKVKDDSGKRTDSPPKSTPTPQGRWWLKQVKVDLGGQMKNPRNQTSMFRM